MTFDVVTLGAVDSTNEEIRRRAAAGAHEGLVVVADSQTAGRGRRGHSWHSPKGAGLYLSLLLRPGAPAASLLALPLRAGLATWRTVVSFGLPAVLKWPNDVTVGGRKIAGILVESQSGADGVVDVAIVGIGLNVEDVPMPAEISETATSLARETRMDVSTSQVAKRLLASLAAVMG